MPKPPLKIYSWNVNGIRAVARKELFQPFLDAEKPDILCLQEIKAKPEQIDLELDGYDVFWYSAEKPGYSGTAILSKVKPLQVINGFPQGIIKKYKVSGDTYGDPNLEGRVMAAEFDTFWVVTVYTPNAKDDLSRIPLRHKHWDPAFLAYCEQLEKSKPVVFCGDLNVAHTPDDLANDKANRGKKGFTDEERAGFQAFVDAGFIDTFRMFKQGKGFYTWWSHFAKARERNVGWRIDYFLVSASLKSNVKAAAIHPKVMGSDHCPISVTLEV
jgi:exodeoxyribonuclease-3